jgi:SAM-dependent methyltransferase
MEQEMSRTTEQRAEEISSFLGQPYVEVLDRIQKGFHHNHALVAKDFNDAQTNVNDPDSLLHWYRTTDSYIFELTAYHLEEGFNYSGMCEGIVNHCIANNWDDVISLGDGIGDLVFDLKAAGLNPTYHDLEGGLNAGYVAYVDPEVPMILSGDWVPEFEESSYDAVVALDFFEHLVNVEDWARAVYDMLRPGGGFLAQNAFAIGDEEHGNSIPMHLAINNKYADEWSSLMEEIGFVTNVGGWWIK